MKNNCICSYEEANKKFFNYCRRHGIRIRHVVPTKLGVEPEMEFFTSEGNSIKILTDTIRGNYSPFLGPAGHFNLMKEMVNQIK